MSWAELDIKGMKELRRNLKGLSGFVDGKEVLDALLDGAKVIQRTVRRKAPKGPTGNLKRAIEAKKFKKQRRRDPAAYVAINYKRGPHAHLVEFGTKIRQPSKSRLLKFEIDGKTIYAPKVKKMPAQPFWRPGVDASKNAAGNRIGIRIAREIERAAARKQLQRYARTIG